MSSNLEYRYTLRATRYIIAATPEEADEQIEQLRQQIQDTCDVDMETRREQTSELVKERSA